MKKRNLKPIVISALLAVSFGATSIGTTFALFTDKAETTINVTAGKVDIEQTISDLVLTSALADDSATVMEDENEKTYTTQTGWVNGGNATYDPTNKLLKLEKMTPGDKVAFNLGMSNLSNVSIKYRLKVTATNPNDYLLKGLETVINGETYSGLKTYVSEWATLAPTDTTHNFGTMSIHLPIYEGNEYQKLSTELKIVVEAVQGNANVNNDEAGFNKILATPSTLQAILNGENGSIDNSTIELAAGTYDKVEFGAASAAKGSNTVYCCLNGNPHSGTRFITTSSEEFLEHLNDNKWHTTPSYYRTISNVTIVGKEGAVVKGMAANTGHRYQEADPVRTGSVGYYFSHSLKNIKFKNIKFTDKVNFATSATNGDAYNNKGTEINGLTFENCEITLNSTESGKQGFRVCNEDGTNTLGSSISNVTFKNNNIHNVFQGIYTQHIKNITVTGNTIDTTGHNAVAVQSGSVAFNYGNVVIENNTFKNIADRVIRAGEVAAGTKFVIKNNKATDAHDSDKEVFKTGSVENGVTYEISGNTWDEGSKFNSSLFGGVVGAF